MDVQQITMDPNVAREAFKAYRDAVRDKYNAEFEALAKGYKAIAQGKSVIDLHAVLKGAGTDYRGRPRFAIARANWEWCFFSRDTADQFWFSRGWTRSNWKKTYVKVPGSCFPNLERSFYPRCKAQVPMIPPMYLPKGNLDNYHILWEANWEDVPDDPILLRHLSGALYAVLAQWDLTELEQAVMRK